jgi:hypothetical protein
MAFPTILTNAVDDSAPGVHDGTPIVAAHLNNLEVKLGIDSSAVVTSLDYLLKNAASINPGHKHSKLWASDGLPEAVDVLADGTVNIFKTTISPADSLEKAVDMLMTITPSGNLGSAGKRCGFFGKVEIPSSNTKNLAAQIVAGQFEVNNESASGLAEEVIGAIGFGYAAGVGNTTTWLAGIGAYTEVDSGTVGDAMGLDVWVGAYGTPGITNLYGIAIGDVAGVATVTNRYQIYLCNPGGVAPTTNDYAIYSLATQPSYLAGGLAIGDAAALEEASLVITSRRDYGDGSWLGSAALNIHGQADEYPGVNIYCYGGTTDYETLTSGFYRARGTKAARSATTAGDYLGYLMWGGFNETLAGFSSTATIYSYQIGAATADGNSGGLVFKVNNGTESNAGQEPLRCVPGPNVMIGGGDVFGTSAAKVLGIQSGTAPTTAPANMGQMWVEDINGAAGYAGLHKITETTAQKEVVPGVIIKTNTGSPANPYEGLMEINTFDNKIRMYGDAGWRELGTW